MFEAIFTYLHESVVPLGVVGVFIAALIETLIAPVPSAFVLYTSGFIFLSNVSGVDLLFPLFLTIAIPAALGATIGSYLIYGLAFYFGKPVLEKWGRWFGVSWDDIEKLRKRFELGWGDEITFTILRSVPIIPSLPLSALAGIIRMKILPYTIASFFGAIVRGAILAYLGAKAGSLYLANANLVDKYENIILMGVLCAITIFVIFRMYIVRQKRGQMVQ